MSCQMCVVDFCVYFPFCLSILYIIFVNNSVVLYAFLCACVFFLVFVLPKRCVLLFVLYSLFACVFYKKKIVDKFV